MSYRDLTKNEVRWTLISTFAAIIFISIIYRCDPTELGPFIDLSKNTAQLEKIIKKYKKDFNLFSSSSLVEDPVTAFKTISEFVEEVSPIVEKIESNIDDLLNKGIKFQKRFLIMKTYKFQKFQEFLIDYKIVKLSKYADRGVSYIPGFIRKKLGKTVNLLADAVNKYKEFITRVSRVFKKLSKLSDPNMRVLCNNGIVHFYFSEMREGVIRMKFEDKNIKKKLEEINESIQRWYEKCKREKFLKSIPKCKNEDKVRNFFRNLQSIKYLGKVYDMTYGEESKQVCKIQEMFIFFYEKLKKPKLYNVENDCKYGPKTKAAIEKFSWKL